MNKKVVYTSVFGDWDDVKVPVLNDDWDWIYFNEKNSLCLYEDNNKIMDCEVIFTVVEPSSPPDYLLELNH